MNLTVLTKRAQYDLPPKTLLLLLQRFSLIKMKPKGPVTTKMFERDPDGVFQKSVVAASNYKQYNTIFSFNYLVVWHKLSFSPSR